MDGDRRRLLTGLVVGALLLLSGVVPYPVFGSPYQTAEPAPYLHQAVDEDDPDFESLVDLYEFDPEAATSVEDLSPTGQLAVERTIAAEPDRRGWHRYELPVCRDVMVVCDSVRSPPPEFQYGEASPQEVFTIVEADGQRYLFQTGVQNETGLSDGFGDQPPSTYLWLFGLLPLGAVVIATNVIAQQTGQQRIPSVLTAVGAGLLVVGVALPYLSVFGVVSYDAIAPALLVGVGVVTLGAVGGLVWQTIQYTGAIER
ncbi:MAG: hypothetical protein ACOCP2_00210 [Halohasta sp.]